jgi:transposase
VLLYDLTSTYVEGAAEKNPMVRRGYSRDHRPDCEQLVIALIVNAEGFPFSYETFDGNRTDVSPGKRFCVWWNVSMGRHAASGCSIAAS